ncbi:MAG: ABC transporter ATP-binding protein [Acidobacteria bacterium]|nr:ABC transporter ATP-binding protein [Acidobacteriota bacterium]
MRLKLRFAEIRRQAAEVRRFYGFLRPYRKWGYAAAFWMGLAVLLQLPMPLFTAYLIDEILPRRDVTRLSWFCGILLAILFARSIALFLQRRYLVRYKGRVVFDIRRRIFEHLQRVPVSYLESTSSGYLLSRVDGDVNQVQGLLAETMIGVGRNLITFLVGCGLLFSFHPKLAAVSVIFLPLYFWTFRHFGRKMRVLNSENRERWAIYTGMLEESISLIPLTKVYGRYKSGVARFCHYLKVAIRTDARTEITGSLSGIVSGIVGGLAPLVLLWLGIAEIMHGRLTLGQFFAFNSLLAYMFGPVSSLVDLNIQIQSSLAAVERIFEILSIQPELQALADISLVTPPDAVTVRSVSFHQVSFRYAAGREGGLRGVSFSISQGEKVAVVGPSGCGKTTIARLLVKFDQPQDGLIMVDGRPITDLRAEAVRARIGYVSQTGLILSGTIRENLLFGNPNASEDMLWEALELVEIGDFVRQLPAGLNTVIGYRGIGLSGGENQRIALARCALKDPELFLLDEATSAVDQLCEARLLAKLAARFRERAFIIITHRLHSISETDRIIVIDHGQVVQQGPHHKLLAVDGLYKQLYTREGEESHAGLVAS